jgi:hypothetical protein
MKLVNLTTHPIFEVQTKTEIPAGSCRAEVRPTRVKTGEFMGLPIYKLVPLVVTGLPEPEEGTRYIVSSPVLNACPDRLDLLSPGDAVRNGAKQVIGCVGFRSNMPIPAE